jgi:hypothetical protein
LQAYVCEDGLTYAECENRDDTGGDVPFYWTESAACSSVSCPPTGSTTTTTTTTTAAPTTTTKAPCNSKKCWWRCENDTWVLQISWCDEGCTCFPPNINGVPFACQSGSFATDCETDYWGLG